MLSKDFGLYKTSPVPLLWEGDSYEGLSIDFHNSVIFPQSAIFKHPPSFLHPLNQESQLPVNQSRTTLMKEWDNVEDSSKHI